MPKENREEIIKELEEIRRKLTKIYMEIGNPKDFQADMILKEDIERYKNIKQVHTNCQIIFGSGEKSKEKFDIIILRQSDGGC